MRKLRGLIDDSKKNPALCNKTVKIGKNSNIEGGVKVHAGTILGSDIRIRRETVIGPNSIFGSGVEVHDHSCVDGGLRILNNTVI